MTQATQPAAAPRAFRADSLALGMSVMLLMTIVQRGIGFFRSIWFCRMLDDQMLGQWAMAFGFVTMITPMLLLGLPGSLPRYVETYRQQGHLRAFLKRILWCTGGLSCAAMAMMLLVPEPFGWLIFRQSTSGSLVAAVGVTVLSVILFNSMNELVAALRQVRVVSFMQFIQSVGFTVIAITWLAVDGRLIGLVFSFAAAGLLGTLPAWWILSRNWQSLPLSNEAFDAAAMWRRVLPYAAALWVMNLLSNAFEFSDRYMILHFSAAADMGQSLVGQYHSARIIPGLFVSVAMMGSGVLLPYMAADWEAGKQTAMAERLRKILFSVSAVFTLGASLALGFAPWLFESLLGGRYSGGLSVLPLAFTISVWAALITVAQNYLWVAERGKFVGWSLAVGLATNLALNAFLLPLYGLHGAVVATLLSHLVVLLGIWLAMRRSGFDWDSSLIWGTLLPATLLGGPIASFACVTAVLLFSSQARRWLSEAILQLAVRGARRL